MSFATVAGVVCALAVGAATLWLGAGLPPGPGRVGVWALLAGALLTVPWVPSPHVPFRVERVHFAGPDLLGDEPERTVVVADSLRAAGWSRVRRLRRTQGPTLLSEGRRVEVRLPWLWALLAGVVALFRKDRSPRIAAMAPALGAAALGAVASGGCVGESAPGPAESRLLEVMEMRRTGDVSAIEEVFLPEGIYEDVAGDVEYRGVQEIAGYLGSLHGWATGVFLDVVEIHDGSRSASAEWFLEGIQSGPIPGRLDTITGRRFRLRGVTLVEIERGGVVRAVDYLDWVPFLLDVGAEIHWPGGRVTTGPP